MRKIEKRMIATILLAFMFAMVPKSNAYAENCLSVRDYGRHMYKEWYYRSGEPRAVSIDLFLDGKTYRVNMEQDKYGVCVCGANAKVGVYTWEVYGTLE